MINKTKILSNGSMMLHGMDAKTAQLHNARIKTGIIAIAPHRPNPHQSTKGSSSFKHPKDTLSHQSEGVSVNLPARGAASYIPTKARPC